MAKDVSTDLDINSIFNKLKDQILLDTEIDSETYLPNIIEFCESKKYLNLGEEGIKLFPVQKIILKVFYRGQMGNEKLALTDKEIAILHELKLENVIEKYYSKNIFRELVLVLGRRCISENSLVLLADGTRREVGQLWDENVRKIDVISLDERDFQFYKSPNAEIIDNGIQDIYEVILKDGRRIEVTDNHPFLTIEGWKECSDLQTDDRIAVPSKIEISTTTSLDKAKARLSGYMTGDGCCSQSSLFFTCANDNFDLSWIAIKSINYAGRKRTFDVSVAHENRHNFIANDIILHNSGKDMMTSLIALYEAMKLLECPGGSPFKYYGLAAGNPIYILTIATSSDQAKVLFFEIKERMQRSSYFREKIGKIESDKIWLKTPEDKKHNKELIEQGLPSAQTPGSIVVMSGHSNSEGLLGKRTFALLLDEVASFKTTGSSLSGDRIYSALTPSTADFVSQNKKKSDGSPMYDSKIISISSPRSEEGILYKLYKEAPEANVRLAIRLPTWKVNLKFSEDSLRNEFKFMSQLEFQMEFGAEFSGAGGEKFIADHYVDEACEMGAELGISQQLAGKPGRVYYAHLDPAATSHNYALVVLHIEDRVRVEEKENGVKVKEKIKMFVVDHIMAWQPVGSTSIQVEKVDQYIIDLAKRFRFAMVSYDSWNSLHSIQKLRMKGIPSKMTQFRKAYKMKIYNQLEDLLVGHKLALPKRGPWAKYLEMELKCLKRIYNPTGFKIKPDPDAQVNTDDLCDGLAGAIGVAMEVTYSGYAKSGVAYLPLSREVGREVWKIGSGTYGTQQWKNIYRKFGKLSGK